MSPRGVFSRALAVATIGLALAAILFAAGYLRPPIAHTVTSLPLGFADAQVASNLQNPTAMAFTPDGRIFVAEQEGDLRVVKDETLLPMPFASVNTDPTGERGLLGVAVDPNFAANQFVYVYYTATSPSVHNRVSRFTANGDVAAGGSEVVILDLDDLSGDVNHNGGAIHFGADGKLYVAVGDNHDGSNSQTLSNRLGKMLRINADGSIPSDNPFFSTASGDNRAIWALGLRNPFTFGVQPGTGRIFINDVGEGTWEEINDGIAGANYGWPNTEGPTSDPAFESPFFAYSHSGGDVSGCAITGGAFYDPPAASFPAEYIGDYYFADFCSGWIKRLDPTTGGVLDFAAGAALPVDVQVGPDGRLYYLARAGGAVHQIRYAAGEPPEPTQTVTFDDLPGQNQVLSGEYPFGVIDWGSNTWWHSEPWEGMTTKSVTFNGGGITSGSFSLLDSRWLVRLDAYNGGAPATVTLTCPGQTNVSVSLASGELRTIETGWTTPCSAITLGSTSGWSTNFDNLRVESAAAGTPQPTPTSAPPTATPTPTTVPPTATPTPTTDPGSTPTPTSTPVGPPPGSTVTFDDLAGQNQPLNGEYPAGVIDWGSGLWWHSEPWRSFTTKSVTFNGPGVMSASFTLLSPSHLAQLRVFNGGNATTVTLSCPGQATVEVSLATNELQTVPTGWTGDCSSVTLSSTNGWDTNFDDLVLQSGSPAVDSDGDGCSDAAEQQQAPGSELFGGRRDPQYFWDFFDTPNESNVRDGVVSAADTFRVASRLGQTGTATSVADAQSPPPATGYHAAFDRSPPDGDLWDLGPPDGAVSAGDIFAVVVQFGHTCA